MIQSWIWIGAAVEVILVVYSVGADCFVVDDEEKRWYYHSSHYYQHHHHQTEEASDFAENVLGVVGDMELDS
jgi:hypothetical protein